MLLTRGLQSDDYSYMTTADGVAYIRSLAGKYTWTAQRGRGPRAVRYVDTVAAFDIETSSFTVDGNKAATMYVWQFGIAGEVIIGRTWGELKQVVIALAETFGLCPNRRLIIYVHNLAFEFSFFCNLFCWDKVFCADTRKPIYSQTHMGLEFRCSYIQTMLSLEKVGENLLHSQIRKLKGDLDYDKMRHSKTPLTEEELRYCINDVRVLMAWEKEKSEEVGGIDKITLTKTGEVREFVKNLAYPAGKKGQRQRKKTQDLMSTLTLDPDEYQALRQAFQGGFTHCSPYAAGLIFDDVHSIDFTSSYPAVMLAEWYPMGRAIHELPKDESELEKWLNTFCCLFLIEFKGLKSKVDFDNILSFSKCAVKGKKQLSNGRIVSCDECRTWITEVDFESIQKFYKWDEISICDFYRYPKGPLPKYMVDAIIYLYKKKTQLKGIKGKEQEYQVVKGMLNALYGMVVTNIAKDEIVFDGEWRSEEVDVAKTIAEYNSKRGRFLFYPWGVWVTAYARRNLYRGILKAGWSYIYSDTDSVKYTDSEGMDDFIEQYNEYIVKKITDNIAQYGYTYADIAPKNKKGKECPIGVWDREAGYEKFKTLGAKRYAYIQIDKEDGTKHFGITIAGVSKKYGAEYLERKYGLEGALEAFKDGLEFPAEYVYQDENGPSTAPGSGKLTHTYIDTKVECDLTDYTGKTAHICELSGTHLQKTSYKLDMDSEYLDYVLGLRYEYR